MENVEYKVQMRRRVCDEWQDAPDFWTPDYERACNFISNGRWDYDGGMWRMIKRNAAGEEKVIFEDAPPRPGLLERIITRLFG